MIYQVRYKNKIRGFTLIELLIVVSVIAIFSSISVVAYKNINERSIFNGAVNTITGAIPYAKNKALNQSLNNNWGVYLQNDSVTIFSGDNYLSRNTTYDEIFKLPNGVTISGLTEIVFDKITGKIENEGNIVISRKEDQRTIHVNYYGVVFYNKDAGETNICQDTSAINYGGILPCQYEGTSPSGTISSSPSSCLITSGNNSCSSSLSWSTTNPINTSIVSKSGSTVATGNSGTQSVSISYGTNTFDLINDGKTLNSVSVTGSCNSGLSWNGSSCVYPSGDINSSLSSCTIASGGSTCSSSLSWSTTNPINTSIVSKSGSTVATGNSGTQSVSISYGTNTFDLINDGKTLNSVSVTGSCISGTTWNNSSCVTSPSGTISSSPSSCLITSGNNSCSSSLSWSTTNPINTSIVSKSGSTVATGNSGTQSVSISYGTNTFDLINDGKTLNSVSVTGSCDSGLSWNGSLCEVEVFVPTFNYTLDMNNDWGSGYCTNVTITTDSPDPVIWEVNIPLTTPPQSGTPNSAWNLTWSFSNQILKISGIAEWNYYVSSSSPNTTGGFCATR